MGQIEGISVETLMLANKYTDEHGGGGGGATDAGSVSYDETKTYNEGTVGAELTAQKNAISVLKTLLLNDLIPILYAGVYTSDQSTAIAAFAAALSGGGGSIIPSYSSGTLTLSGFESTPGWNIT